MHIQELTPNKTVAESWINKSFLFDISSSTSWKELLYNSTLMRQPHTVFKRHL